MDEEAKGEEVTRPTKKIHPVLKLKAPGTPTWGKICPGCGTELDKETVVCHHCGWNFNTGKKERGAAEVLRRKRIFARVTKGIMWGLLLWVVAVTVLWTLEHRSEVERWVGKGMEWGRGIVGYGGGGMTEAESDDAVIERLNRELPMWREGDEVRLEKTNGAVLTGVLRGVGEVSVTVETPEGMRTVAMGSLSGRSRVRVDVEYRAQVIRARLDKP